MIEELQRSLMEFWSGFGVPAYIDGLAINISNPKKPPPMPYITFNFNRDDFMVRNTIFVRIWDNSTSFTRLWEIAEKIEKAIPHSGKLIRLDSGGGIILRRGTPFIQPMPMDDRNLRVLYVNLETVSYVF